MQAVGDYEAAFSDAEEDETNKSALQGQKSDSSPAGDVFSYAGCEDCNMSLGIAKGDKTDSSLQEDSNTSSESHAGGSEGGEKYHTADLAAVSPCSSTPNSEYYYFYQGRSSTVTHNFVHSISAGGQLPKHSLKLE